ncbi:unnamed protein product [Rotaria sp. Silwood1]|nr:unnamed protein product [Rotaria sp. Silwood1]CAF4841920.1 unnamed protein product [Rotaria sp. Silwood1]
MGNRSSNRAPPVPYPAVPPPVFIEPFPRDNFTSTNIRRRREYRQNPLPPKVRAIFIPQASPVGIYALPMAVAAPVVYPAANLVEFRIVIFIVRDEKKA